MGQKIVNEKKLSIPIQRAANALGTALTRGKNEYHFVRFLEMGTRTNLYFTYSSRATRDENGNYDSPIFQDSRYNNMPPLWQLFREQLESKSGHKIIRVVYGKYRKGTDGEEFFKVKDKPIQGSWVYIEEPGDKVSITQLAPDEAKEAQAILDGLRRDRADRIAKERADLESSKKSRESGIAYLKKKYRSYFERFVFEEKIFRFRQFNKEFLYTKEGLEDFDNFYRTTAKPYRQDELADERWRKKSREIKNKILSDPELSKGLILEKVHEFRFTRLEDGGCEVSIDLIDDRTGRQFNVHVSSRRPSAILKTVTANLRVLLQRKEQARRAVGTLQSLASGKT